MAIKVEQISEVFPILTPGMELRALPFDGPAFYGRLDEEFGDFGAHVLVSCHSFDEAWPTWEMHPNGDECVILLSGDATMALLMDGETQHYGPRHRRTVCDRPSRRMAYRDTRRRRQDALHHTRRGHREQGAPAASITMRYFEDFIPGERYRLPGSHHFTEEEIMEFAGRWDPQPFHIDREAAADSIFGGVVACSSHIIAASIAIAVTEPGKRVCGCVEPRLQGDQDGGPGAA